MVNPFKAEFKAFVRRVFRNCVQRGYGGGGVHDVWKKASARFPANRNQSTESMAQERVIYWKSAAASFSETATEWAVGSALATSIQARDATTHECKALGYAEHN